MPEGPSIKILQQELQQFEGHKVISASGNTKLEGLEHLRNKTLQSFKTWGKHLLICFSDSTIKIHLLMFGSYRINEEKDSPVRLNLTFNNGYVNFYACQVKWLEDAPDKIYDWSGDLMNESWDPEKALEKIQERPESMICDLLMDQDIFAGLGNIIKNEILFRAEIHPESKAGRIPLPRLKKLVKEAHTYSFEFMEWKLAGTLKKHWQAHTKPICPKCKQPITRKVTGKGKRRSFFCQRDQELYE